MYQFKKGDWVVSEEGDIRPLLLVSEPYEVSVYREGRPISSYQALVANSHTDEQINLKYARPATGRDFLIVLERQRDEVKKLNAATEALMADYGAFLKVHHNLNNND